MDAVLPEAYTRWRGTRLDELTERLSGAVLRTA